MAEDAIGLQEFSKDIDWLLKHRDELLPKYGDTWVAVWREKIVDQDKDLDELVRRLRDEGRKPQQMAIEFLSREPIEAIL